MGNPYAKTRKNRSQGKKMPFGKFKGFRIEDLPSDYLGWLSELDNLREPLRSAILQEIEERECQAGISTQGGLSLWIDESDVELARKIFEMGRRAAAVRYHPDVQGGRGDIMKRINCLVTSICKQLEGA